MSYTVVGKEFPDADIVAARETKILGLLNIPPAVSDILECEMLLQFEFCFVRQR
ncbi:hypothetical protein [Brucella intermedia]|uniref:hypothetical protein n=1 Tax=Brucella intermedia TaxID=94625 RepID=UPI001FFE6A72|nr:hypothetical protein [Brucella intermedia]